MFEPFKILVLKVALSQETSVSGGTKSFSRGNSTWLSSGVSGKWVMGMGSVVVMEDFGAENRVEVLIKRVFLQGNLWVVKGLEWVERECDKVKMEKRSLGR